MGTNVKRFEKETKELNLRLERLVKSAALLEMVVEMNEYREYYPPDMQRELKECLEVITRVEKCTRNTINHLRELDAKTSDEIADDLSDIILDVLDNGTDEEIAHFLDLIK